MANATATNATQSLTTPHTGIYFKFGPTERENFIQTLISPPIGAAALAVLVGAIVLLWVVLRFRVDRSFVSAWRCLKAKEEEDVTKAWCVALLLKLAVMLPIVLTVAWGSMTLGAVPGIPLLGYAIIFLGLALYATIWASTSWVWGGYSSSTAIRLGAALAALLFIAFEATALHIDGIVSTWHRGFMSLT